MSLSKNDLRLLGASLYLGEGTKAREDKRGRKVYAAELTNKDPRVIRVYMRFLREVINADEERVKAELFAYPDHDIKKLEKFWSSVAKVPLRRFNKTILLKQRNSKYKPNPLGTIKIRYSHKEHFLKIQAIIDEIFGETVQDGEVA